MRMLIVAFLIALVFGVSVAFLVSLAIINPLIQDEVIESLIETSLGSLSSEIVFFVILLLASNRGE